MEYVADTFKLDSVIEEYSYRNDDKELMDSIFEYYNGVDGFIEKVKKYAYKGRNWLAKQLTRLNQWARDINEKIKKEAGSKEATIWQKIKNKIAQAISWITQKMANAAGDTANRYGEEGHSKIQDHDFSLGGKK